MDTQTSSSGRDGGRSRNGISSGGSGGGSFGSDGENWWSFSMVMARKGGLCAVNRVHPLSVANRLPTHVYRCKFTFGYIRYIGPI